MNLQIKRGKERIYYSSSSSLLFPSLQLHSLLTTSFLPHLLSLFLMASYYNDRLLLSSRFLLLLCLGSSSLSPASAQKVSLELYYETLCPFCSDFIVNHLSKIFRTSDFISIVDLRLFPYGNARLETNGSISCQHGQYECLLNTVEACAISTWPDALEHFNFIYCIERLVKGRQYTNWEACFQQAGYDPRPVINCYNSGYGNQLEMTYKTLTDALQPPHAYVPWVVVDGQPLYDDYENFESYICRAYRGPLPAACERQSLVISENTEEPLKRKQFCPY